MTIWTNDEVGGTVWSGAEEEPISTIETDLVVEGDTQIGDAAGDALVIWPSSVTWQGSPVTHSGAHTFSGAVTHSGQLITADGSVSTPALKVGDEQNGLSSPSANNLAVSTGGTGALQVDSSQRVLVGFTSALTASSTLPSLQVAGTTADKSFGMFARFTADAGGPAIQFGKSRAGTVGTFTVAQADDRLGTTQFYGADGTDFALGAEIIAAVDGTAGSGDMPTRLVLATSPDGAEGSIEGLRIDRNQCVGINNTNPSASARLIVTETAARIGIAVQHTGASNSVSFIEAQSESYASTISSFNAFRAASSAFNFMSCGSDTNGTPDTEFAFRGDGVSSQDGGTAWGTPADYAEFFESVSGNAIPLGNTVVLVGDKVRRAVVGDPLDDIMGVVRPKSGHASIVANSASMKWTNKYLRDDETGEYLLEDYTVYEWEEADQTKPTGRVMRSVASYKIPQGMTIPPNATTKVQKKRKLNPAWDPAVPYIPRAERPEWNVIGLVGQVLIRKGDPVNPRWRKMKDVSATVELWFIR
jgi:hypothetical protein